MERYSDAAINLINALHTERLDYDSEYLPLINAANALKDYEDTGLAPEEIPTGLELANVFCALEKLRRYESIGTVEHLIGMQAALCILCRDIAKRDGNVLGCYSCHYRPTQQAKPTPKNEKGAAITPRP